MQDISGSCPRRALESSNWSDASVEVNSFPSDALTINGNGRLTFCRPLERRDWSRVLLYVPRIKTLKSKKNKFPTLFSGSQHDLADITVWQMLAISKPPTLKHLLPNLRYLTWHESQDATSPYITLLLAPTITHFDLWTKPAASESPLILSMFPSLHELCPRVEHIEVLGQVTAMGIRLVSETVSQWDRLRQLNIDAVTPRALLHLASLTALEILHIYSTIQLGEVLKWSGDEYFPALRELVLRRSNITWVTDFVILAKPRRLQFLTVRFLNHYPRSQWKPFLASLKLLKSSLTEIVIIESASVDQARDVLDRETLMPLLDLSNLVSLIIQPTRGFDIDDDALKELSAAWPRLRRLKLGDSQTGLRPRITLPGLIPLIVNCPLLDSLSITFDASVIDYPPKSSLAMRNEKLKSLKVGMSPIEDSVNVAAFLLDLAPNLTIVESHRGDPGMAEMWGHVARLLQTFAKCRLPVV